MSTAPVHRFRFHIRRPLRPAGGNQFYRDRSNRGRGAYCGTENLTSYDVGHRDKAEPWVKTAAENPEPARPEPYPQFPHGVDIQMIPCVECVAARKAERS